MHIVFKVPIIDFHSSIWDFIKICFQVFLVWRLLCCLLLHFLSWNGEWLNVLNLATGLKIKIVRFTNHFLSSLVCSFGVLIEENGRYLVLNEKPSACLMYVQKSQFKNQIDCWCNWLTLNNYLNTTLTLSLTD